MLDLAEDGLAGLDPCRRRATGRGAWSQSVPIMSAPACLRAAVADPGAVAHLGERRLEVARRAGSRRPGCSDTSSAASPVAGDEVGVGQPVLGPGEGVEGLHLDEQHPDHQVGDELEVDVDVVGQRAGSRPCAARRAAAARSPCGRAWRRCRPWRWGTRRRCRGRRTTCPCGRPPPPSRPRRGRGPRTGPCRGGRWRCRGCPPRSAAAGSPGCRRRMLAPKPSTVPMRVRVAMSGSGTPAGDEVPGLGDVRVVLRPRVERDVRGPRCRRWRVCWACQASMAGTRCRVRGDT